MRKKQMYNREKYILKKYTPSKLWELMDKHCAYIAGGAITSVFSRSRINDLDLYFYSKENRNAFVSELQKYVKPTITTVNAITYKWDKCVFQVVMLDSLLNPPYNENFSNFIFDNFDFTICMGMYSVRKDHFWFNENFLRHLAAKRLVYNTKSRYPIASMFRLSKYIKRGFKLSAISSVSLALKIHTLELTDYEVLSEQLNGIDTLFLKPLTDEMRKQPDTQYDFESFMAFAEKILEERCSEDDID